MGFRRNPRRVIGLTLPFLPRDPRISFPARTEAQGLLRYSLPRSMLSNFLYNLPLNIHFFDFRFTPRKRLRKNPLLFHGKLVDTLLEFKDIHLMLSFLAHYLLSAC